MESRQNSKLLKVIHFIPSSLQHFHHLTTTMNGFEVCVPNDHIIFVDDASQGAVFNGKAISYDDAGSAFKAVDKNITHIHN